MADWQGLVATDRGVIAMTGADAREVLQGVITNDIERLAPGAPLYAALLTPQGKYLFDFILVDAGDGRILFDIARDQGQDLAKRLMMYCLRRDAKVEGTGAMAVGLVWGECESPEVPGHLVVSDPREPALGYRIYGPDPVAGLTKGSRESYEALRVEHAVPEAGAELLPNETFILEAGFERLGGVDFRKGCYVGQEVTARMKHKTELRKGLAKVEIEGYAEPGTEIIANGKKVGTLYTTSGTRGLAHLRFDRAGPNMEVGTAKVSYSP